MDETTNDPRQDLVQQSLASGAPPLNPFIPTAVSADTGSQSPFFVDAAKQAEEFNLTQQIQSGKAGVKFMGNQDQYEFFQNADVAPNTLGNVGFEHTMKYSATASKGWGEQNTYGRDSWLRWMKGENSNYFWNPSDLNDPSNQHNHSSWFSAVGEGIGKWFVDQSADAEFQDMKKQIETIDPTYTEDIRLQDTSDFLDNNLGVSRVLLAGGVNLYDYTRNTNNKLGLKFAINNAVIDSLQNVRLRKWDQNNQSFFGAGKLGDMLTYGIQDPLLVRDIVVTTALTLGLGTLEVGAARLAAGLGEVTTAGRTAMGVATTASKLLQFTSPFTGLVEGPVYKGLQTLLPNVGKSGIKTMMARGLAIGTENGIQGGLSAYQDQRNEYDWRNLIFQNPQSAFRPDWVGVAQGAATGFGAGGLMLGLMRFGLGALTGEARLLKSGKMKEYWQGVANSLDTWATTDKGLTVFGNELSNGRGIAFGNMIDKYLKNTVDDRDFASIMLNGSKMYSNATFSPEIAAKSGFDEKASAKIADAFAEATGLPGEIIQRYAPEHPVRLFFDNLMDPEYMDRTGLTYADTLKIFDAFKNKRAGLLGPSEVSLVGTTKAIQEIQSKENLVALAHVFELDRVHRIIQKSGLAFDTVAESFRKVTGQDLDFGVDNHRSNFAVVADYSVANSGLLQKHMDVLGFAKSGNKLRDYVNPDGLTIDGAVLRDSIRKTLDLDSRTGRLFVTDSYAGSEPNFIISIEPDGTMNRHATKLVIENSVVKPYNEVTKSPDYIPENIKTSQDMKESFGQLARDVKAVYEEKKAVRIAKAKDELKKISDIADSKSATPKEKATGEKVRKAWQDIGRLPTRTILEKHFNLSSAEAAAAEIVMETLGHDLEGMILKIAKSENYLANNKMAAALQWERIESGVRALIRTGKHSDFGSLIHEMGHYNRAIFIGNTPENKAFRNKIGVSDELWKKFLKWCGNEDEIWLGSPEAMKLEELAKGGDKNAKAKLAEITKSEEKFATAWHHYVRSVMIGDGKTKATGLHRLFSAMGDHLGDLGKKMEMISTFEKELVMSPEAKEVFDKLFLRSQNNLTKFWDNANANIFKNMDPTERAKLGEYILGTELWNTHKAVTEIAAEKAAKVIDPVVKIKIIKTKMVDIIDGIKAKVSGSAFEPTKKSIHSSLKAGKTVEQIEGSITKARAMLNTPELFTAHGNRPPAPDSYFASHVRNLSDEQLQALPPGKVLQPIEGVVSWFHNDKTNELDVSFPVVTATKELIAKEIQRRQQSKAALKRLRDAVASRDKAAKVITGVETRVKAATTKPVKVETPTPAMKTDEISVPSSSLTKLKPSELAIPESTGKLGLLEVQKLEAADAEKAKFTSIGEADSTDPEMLALIEQARQERAIVETEAPILAKAISDSVEAAKEIAASELEVERTSITVVKENEEVTPETAMAEVKDSIDPRFVDESGTPVIGLTPEEKVVLEATQTLIDDAVTEEKQIAQIITNAADESVPIAAIETTVVRVKSPTINVNRISKPRVSKVIEPATVIVRALQVDAEKAAAALPPEILMKVEEIDTLTIVRIDPKARLELIKTILGSTTEDITDLPQLEKMLEKYFEARARASIAENALDKFGSLTEAENERWKAIPPKLLSDLEGDEEIDLIILHPEESSIPRRVAGRHNISVDDVMFVADIRKRRTQGLLAAADEVDTKEMARLEPSYRKNEQAKKLLEIEKNPTEIENLNKIIRATQADHGKYKAAAEKIINRELYGASTNKVQRISVHDETVKEIIKNGKPKNPVELIKENTDRQVRIIALRQALGLHTSWMDQDGRIAALGFNIFDSISDAKTGPSLSPVRMTKSFSKMVNGEEQTKKVDINSARLIATNIVADILSGKSSLKTVEDLVVYYATNAYKKQAQLLSELTPDKPLALINNNPVLYHSILAILLEAEELDAAILKRLDPSKIVEELVEINRLVKETKITGTTAVKVERSISDVEFAHVLMHDNSFMSKVQRLVRTDEEVSPAEMIAKVYRTKSGIKNFFITRLGLDEKISDYDLLRAIQNWSNGKQPNTKLANSVRTVLDNLVKDSNKTSAKEISGEGVEDVSLGLLATTGEDLRVTKANMHHATVVDALMSLFYNYLEGKKIIDGGESMQDFFLARIASADPSQSQSTLSALKTMGIDINKNALVHRDEKLSAEIRSFFGDLVDDPEVGDGVKEVIKNNFGIGQKGTRESKAKGVVQGRTVDEWDQALDVRAMIFSEEIKNVDDVLEFISGNESTFSKLANELRTTARRDMKAVRIYPVSVEGPAPVASFSSLTTSILINDKKPYGFTPRIVIHEVMHSITNDLLSKIEQYGVFTGIKYLEVVQNFVDSSKGKAYDPVVELAEAYLEMVSSGNFKINKDKINRISSTVRVLPDDMEFYGSLNMHEMVSEAFSNPVFADRLHQVSSTSRADRSIFNKVFDAIIEMFGLKDKENITLLEKIVLATDDIVKKKQWTKEEKARMLLRDKSGISSLDPVLQKEINLSFETNRKQMTEVLTEIFKARDDLTSAKGRYNKSLGEVTQGRTLISTAIEEPKFKPWFKDSKVVKSTSLLEESYSSEPMLMYHGSGSAGFDEFKGFDFSKHDTNNLLFGAGAYFTESPKLASSYAKPKRIREGDVTIGTTILHTEGMEWINTKRVIKNTTDENILYILDNTYDRDGDITSLEDLFINLNEEGASDDAILALAKKLGVNSEEIVNNVGVYPVYLSIQKPIDADNDKFTIAKLKDLAENLKPQDKKIFLETIRDHITPTENPIKVDSLFGTFNFYGVEHLFIQALMKDGYDGLSHIGGIRRGFTEHRVFVAWKNTQIKSPFNKNFDPNVGSISGRTLGEPLDVLSDAVDLRRRKLASMGLHEETTMEDMNSIHRVLNGLDPIDTQTNKIFDSIKTPMNLSKATVISKAFAGKTYRSLSETERREFISSSLIPRIREAMGDRNSSAGIYSAASDTTFGKKVNSLIGGAIQYGDTADSNSILLQFISKIFDPMMDLRNGELKNKFNLPSIDKLNTEVNNLLLRSEMVQLRDKVLGRVKDQAELKRINDVAWDYMTRESEVPAMVNRDLVMETIKVQNKFNELTVDLLSKYGELSKNIDPKTYGTAHVANTHAHQNQGGFVEALTNHAVAKTLEKKQISVITASALGWLSIKRDSHTDNITSIKIEADSPLAVLLSEKEIGKRLEWKGSTIKLFNDIEKLSKDAQETHNKGLTSNEDYTADWNASYKKEGEEYTAIKQSMTIAKNRYLGIDFGDSKSSAPRRMSIGEGNNYAEERIISHDELVRNPELSQYFSKNIFQLANDQLRGSITDSMMTKYLSEFFGTRMSMSDLIQVLSGVGEESIGRSHLSASEIASRKRGYERLRSAWDHSIGNWTSSTDSVDKYYRVLLENSRVPLVAASGLRAAINSIPETARAILSSNKNRAMLTQALPNMVKMVQLIGPGGKNRRLARQQMISASHWLRGLSTDHMLHRASLHPDNPFAGAVFGQGAGGMISNFVNTWRAAGEMNKVETNWLQKASNRLSAFSSAVGAPLAFINDVTTTLHIWNAQENMTTNIKEFRKMADLLAKNPTASYSEFGHLARKCGLAPKEALDLSTAGLLDPKYIDILHAASKNQSLYSDGMLDAKKLFTWAGDDQEKVEAINRMGSYINMTARHTNVEPTLLDIRVNQSIFGKSLSQYMQFMLSMGVQEIGRRRRTMTSGYSQHLAGLMLMEAMAYGSSRALADPVNDETGGYDEFVKNPTDFVIRTATSLPLLGSYAFLSQIMRHSIMGTSEFLGGPEASGKFNLPDLVSGPASTAPSRLLRTPETIKSWYNLGHDVLGEMIQN